MQNVIFVTDFGSGPYTGQMRLRVKELLPRIDCIDLISDLPPYRPDLAAYLLPALTRDIGIGNLYLCIVDPGVGGERDPLAVWADGNWFVAPDNGILSQVVRQAVSVKILCPQWRPRWSSDSFHGRDLFAPIAARIIDDQSIDPRQRGAEDMVGSDWPDDLARVVYTDRYGNLLTGVRADRVSQDKISAGGQRIPFARTFCEVAQGAGFWYENAFGLVELAVNQGRADQVLALAPGDAVDIKFSCDNKVSASTSVRMRHARAIV